MVKKISVVETVKNMSDDELLSFIGRVYETGYLDGRDGSPCDYLKVFKVLIKRG